MSYRRAKEKFRGICECGDHAWADLTKGYVVLVSPQDAALISNRACQALVSKTGKVYATVTIDGIPKYVHREILRPSRGALVDHANGNTLDNRRERIRVATTQQNVWNMRRHRDASSPYKCVRFRYGRWRAHIQVDGRQVALGVFQTARDAAIAYDRAAVMHFGEFAQLNFPEVKNV